MISKNWRKVGKRTRKIDAGDWIGYVEFNTAGVYFAQVKYKTSKERKGFSRWQYGKHYKTPIAAMRRAERMLVELYKAFSADMI